MVVQYLVKNKKKLLKVSHDKKLARYETSKIFKVKENSEMSWEKHFLFQSWTFHLFNKLNVNCMSYFLTLKNCFNRQWNVRREVIYYCCAERSHCYWVNALICSRLTAPWGAAPGCSGTLGPCDQGVEDNYEEIASIIYASLSPKEHKADTPDSTHPCSDAGPLTVVVTHTSNSDLCRETKRLRFGSSSVTLALGQL